MIEQFNSLKAKETMRKNLEYRYFSNLYAQYF